MTRAVDFVVCGYGHIGKKHASLIGESDNCRLVGIIDIDNQKRNEAEKQFKVPAFISLADFFSSGIKADVVNICTPNGLHAQQAVECLQQGCHVVIEKPVALTVEQGEQIRAAKAKSGCEVFCVMQNRFSPPVKWLKEIVCNGKTGQLLFVQVNCFWNRDSRYYTKDSWRGSCDLDGGTLFTQFSHFIDLLIWLFGPLRVVSGNFFNLTHQEVIDFEDSGNFTLKTQNGGVINFSYTTSVPGQNLESSITIIAEKGSIKIGGQYMNKLEHCSIEGVEFPELPDANPANDYGAFKGSAFNHSYIIENVIEVLTGKAEVATPLDEGLMVTSLIEDIYSLKKKFTNISVNS